MKKRNTRRSNHIGGVTMRDMKSLRYTLDRSGLPLVPLYGPETKSHFYQDQVKLIRPVVIDNGQRQRVHAVTAPLLFGVEHNLLDLTENGGLLGKGFIDAKETISPEFSFPIVYCEAYDKRLGFVEIFMDRLMNSKFAPVQGTLEILEYKGTLQINNPGMEEGYLEFQGRLNILTGMMSLDVIVRGLEIKDPKTGSRIGGIKALKPVGFQISGRRIKRTVALSDQVTADPPLEGTT